MYISEYSWGPGPRGTFLIHPTLCPLPFSILGNIFREVLELFSPPPQSLDGRRVRTVPRGRENLANRVKRRGSFPFIRRVPLSPLFSSVFLPLTSAISVQNSIFAGRLVLSETLFNVLCACSQSGGITTAFTTSRDRCDHL